MLRRPLNRLIPPSPFDRIKLAAMKIQVSHHRFEICSWAKACLERAIEKAIASPRSNTVFAERLRQTVRGMANDLPKLEEAVYRAEDVHYQLRKSLGLVLSKRSCCRGAVDALI
jgi:hypothetical protein